MGFFDSVKDGISRVYNDVKAAVGTVYNDAKSGISGVLDNVFKLQNNIVDSTEDTVKSLGNDAEKLGSNIAESIPMLVVGGVIGLGVIMSMK